ncbi:MAG TPA: hypothetical protein VG323_01945 [Thermoanaerobaculia bacterium]|nr:hypothetical protein [Thermoanaerobaculia bacterium]
MTAATATIAPAAPTVGDPIAIDFPAPVVLDPSPSYEIVSQRGAHVVVRTFDAKPFTVSGRMGNVAFTNLVVPVRSVLKGKEAMTPAPLVAPRSEPFPVSVLITAAIVALLIAVALFALLRRRKKPVEVVPEIAPAERFRQTVDALRHEADTPERWAKLADALRDYLAAASGVGRELTTTEVLARRNEEIVARILRHGDLEKFSPWGTEGDFERIAEQALELAA